MQTISQLYISICIWKIFFTKYLFHHFWTPKILSKDTWNNLCIWSSFWYRRQYDIILLLYCSMGLWSLWFIAFHMIWKNMKSYFNKQTINIKSKCYFILNSLLNMVSGFALTNNNIFGASVSLNIAINSIWTNLVNKLSDNNKLWGSPNCNYHWHSLLQQVWYTDKTREC